MKINRIKKPQPEVSTASLPDIIFILLFFFMVVTVLRKNSTAVITSLPAAEELNKLRHRSLTNYFYIGKPKMTKYGDKERIQINDKFISVENLEESIEELKSKFPKHVHNQLESAFQIDEETRMKIVTDLKIALRKSKQLKVLYLAEQDE